MALFRSFFQAGFEGATGYNRHGEWIDQIAATEHDLFADEDYQRLREAGLLTVREAVRWPLVDRNRDYDFSSLEPFLAAGAKHGIEIIHDLFHFGYPAHIDLFSADFPRRFADYCFAVADYLARQTPGVIYFTPVNEPSFFSWAAGEVGLFAPHAVGRGWELKVQLIEAAIQGINAIRAACPLARIVNADPLCRVTAPPGRADLRDEVEYFNTKVVFQSWDMLCGRLMPELGGSPQHLDIVGINYYWTNQWEWGRAGGPLGSDDPRRVCLSELVHSVWLRYGHEMLITETSQVSESRAAWLRELADEAKTMLDEGLQLHGICLYPILGMPEWHARHEWTQMGLWELRNGSGRLERVLHEPMMEALREAQWLEEHPRRTVQQNFREIGTSEGA
ncbi:MAG TPA: glycoside hydrolase [Blastocatellia bacterium]|nr:glycoside hydrolase [Blastocatellia bacterium]